MIRAAALTTVIMPLFGVWAPAAARAPQLAMSPRCQVAYELAPFHCLPHAAQQPMSALGQKRTFKTVRPFIEKRYRRDVEHARARALYRFRSGLLAGPAIQNNNPDQGCDHQRATESRCQCPVIYCRDLHVCRLGGAANAICEVGHNNMKCWLMSALGQKQTFAEHAPISALPPKADMCAAK